MSDSPSLFSLEQYNVEDSVGYLLARSRMMLVKAIDEMTAELGITSAQGGIVCMLFTGKYSTAAELARELYIDAASMKRMLDRLVARDLIRREPNAEDRRLINLCLTPAGQALAQKLPSIYVDVLNRSFSGFTAE